MNYTYLQQYMEISELVKNKINLHLKEYGLTFKNEICAWYEDLNDFYSDWCNIGYTKKEAYQFLKSHKNEFLTFENGNIIRFAL